MSGNISKNPQAADATPNKDDVPELNNICVAGITPFTTIDFPGRLAGVFYLQGCPWRCRYCYNAEFWPMPPAGHYIPLEKILHFLESRRGHLDGIVFSGGEPTAHADLGRWMKAVKDMGYEAGLHTNGMFPEKLREVLRFSDWVGMDVKAPFHLYEKITLIPESGTPARESAALLVSSGVPHEFRTTVHPDLLSENEVLELARDLVSLGAKHYVLQAFRSEHCPDKELREGSVASAGISANLRLTLQSMFPFFQVRD